MTDLMNPSANPTIVAREIELSLALSARKGGGFSARKPRRYISGTAVSSDKPNSNGVSFVASGVEVALPVPLLWNHEWTRPMGLVVAIETGGNQVRFKAEIANDTAWVEQIWEAIVSGSAARCSVEGHNTAHPAIGRTFSRWRLAEISVVQQGADSGARIERVWEAGSCVFLDGRPSSTLYWSTP